MWHYKFQSGIVLMTVLLFFMITSMIGLHLLECNLWVEKISAASWRKHTHFMAAEGFLRQAESALRLASPQCLIPITSRENLLAESLKWEQFSGVCSGQDGKGHYRYYYVVELLGNDPCAEILNFTSSSTVQTAVYFRITLLSINNKDKSRQMLQSTTVKPDNTPPNCNGKRHHVFLGRQMWRVI